MFCLFVAFVFCFVCFYCFCSIVLSVFLLCCVVCRFTLAANKPLIILKLLQIEINYVV